MQFLQTEIWTHAFHGIVNLHSDDTSGGLYGFVNGAVLSENLIEPALREAEQILLATSGAPSTASRRAGELSTNRTMACCAPCQDCRSPFELTLETPQKAPLHRQAETFSTALKTILVEYRYLMAIAQNI